MTRHVNNFFRKIALGVAVGRMVTVGLVVSMFLLTLLLGGCGGTKSAGSSSESSSAAGQKIIIGQSSWIGYAPLYIAQDKGFFKDHGVNVEIQPIESKADSKSALASGRIQGISTTVDVQVINASAGIDAKQILALDTSDGGDGIVAKNEYKTLEDLKGKKVAMDTTGTAYFWFLYQLNQKGMDVSEFDVQNMASGDAGAAFIAGNVDAAVTWEPWLTKVKKAGAGYTMVSSKETPGVIVDTLALDSKTLEVNPDAAKGIAAAWYDALAFMKDHPDEAMDILSKHLGEKKEDIQSELKNVHFYDQSENKAYFGTKEQPGKLYEITKMISDMWVQHGIIEKAVDPEALIDGSGL